MACMCAKMYISRRTTDIIWMSSSRFGYDLGAKIIISCVRTGLNVCHLDTHCYFSHIIDLVPQQTVHRCLKKKAKQNQTITKKKPFKKFIRLDLNKKKINSTLHFLCLTNCNVWLYLFFNKKKNSYFISGRWTNSCCLAYGKCCWDSDIQTRVLMLLRQSCHDLRVKGRKKQGKKQSGL